MILLFCVDVVALLSPPRNDIYSYRPLSSSLILLPEHEVLDVLIASSNTRTRMYRSDFPG